MRDDRHCSVGGGVAFRGAQLVLASRSAALENRILNGACQLTLCERVRATQSGPTVLFADHIAADAESGHLEALRLVRERATTLYGRMPSFRCHRLGRNSPGSQRLSTQLSSWTRATVEHNIAPVPMSRITATPTVTSAPPTTRIVWSTYSSHTLSYPLRFPPQRPAATYRKQRRRN